MPFRRGSAARAGGTQSGRASGALLARTASSTECPHRVAFFDGDDAGRGIGGDRGEFLGRNGSMRMPAELARTHLSGRLGAGLDPCATLQVKLEAEEFAGRRKAWQPRAHQLTGWLRRYARMATSASKGAIL